MKTTTSGLWRIALGIALVCSGTAAQDAPAGAAVTIPAGTEVHFSLVAPVSTRTAKPQDMFALTTTSPIVIDGIERLPAGLPATGQVIHAQKAGAFGKAGELILAVRKIDFHGQSIPMHKFEPLNGKDRTNSAVGVAIAVGVFAAFVRGGQIDLPAGTEIVAYVQKDTELRPAQADAAALPPSTSPNP